MSALGFSCLPSRKSLHSRLQALLSPATALWVEQSQIHCRYMTGLQRTQWSSSCLSVEPRQTSEKQRSKINGTMTQSAFCYGDEDIQRGRWISFEGWVWLLQIEGSARVVVVVVNTVTPSRDLCQQSAACSQSMHVCVCVCVFLLLLFVFFCHPGVWVTTTTTKMSRVWT